MASKNVNNIVTGGFSNLDSERLYDSKWQGMPEVAEKHAEGLQCGGCAFFAPFNSDWGLCCYDRSPHHLETVFGHFTCPAHVNEGWGAHSFRYSLEIGGIGGE